MKLYAAVGPPLSYKTKNIPKPRLQVAQLYKKGVT